MAQERLRNLGGGGGHLGRVPDAPDSLTAAALQAGLDPDRLLAAWTRTQPES